MADHSLSSLLPSTSLDAMVYIQSIMDDVSTLIQCKWGSVYEWERGGRREHGLVSPASERMWLLYLTCHIKHFSIHITNWAIERAAWFGLVWPSWTRLATQPSVLPSIPKACRPNKPSVQNSFDVGIVLICESKVQCYKVPYGITNA